MVAQTDNCTIFEGSEKRLEISFTFGSNSPKNGLRQLAREEIEYLLDKAACCAVSQTSNTCFDAYVLSESSLFVYPSRLVIKTCGNTHLLNAATAILSLASGLDMAPCRCKYSRASYLFPELQPELYQSFANETSYLEEHFGHLGESGSYILGDDAHGLQWHVYIVGNDELQRDAQTKPIYTLEVCMTELCPAKASQFVRHPEFVSAQHATSASGISSLLPHAIIDDFVFDPCGYSMNGLEGNAFSTIHITPECGFSYASLELCGYNPKSVDPTAIVAKAMEIFRPGRVTVSLSVDQDVKSCKWASSLTTPSAYRLDGTSAQCFPCGGSHFHYSLRQADKMHSAFQTSPSTVLDNIYARSNESSDMSSTEGLSRSSTPGLDNEKEAAEAPLFRRFPGLTDVLEEQKVPCIQSGSAESIEAHLASMIREDSLEDPLYCVDLGKVASLYLDWVNALPRVTPFYAVKCFPDRAIVATLAALGAGFDCASASEMQLVSDLGVPPDRIVLANCCKRPKDVRLAARLGVQMTTFDTVCELEKIAAMHPSASALLRIRADDPDARCQLGNKYGAEHDTIVPLLMAAKEKGVNVIGVSFHVGSAATNPKAFEEGILTAKQVFEAANKLGFDMGVLDIGGGFGSSSFSLQGESSIPAAVNRALDLHFPESPELRIIAEPGRYFTEEAATLACMIMGVRSLVKPDGSEAYDYYIPDGLYGSMNSLLYDHAVLSAHPLEQSQRLPDSQLSNATVFGPTCDGLDVVLSDYQLPRMGYGDWLVFPKMGAYTLAGASDFNGMGVSESNVAYVFSSAANN